MPDMEIILIGLLVIAILYLLCYRNSEQLYLPDDVIGARLDAQGIMQIPNASLDGLVKKENYVVENCCGRQENCCGKKENYAVGNCCGQVPSGYRVENCCGWKNNPMQENCCGKRENYQVDKYMIDNMSNLDGLTSYDAKIAPIVNANRNRGEHFGSNPLNALSTMDFTMNPFSQDELEPFRAEHAVNSPNTDPSCEDAGSRLRTYRSTQADLTKQIRDLLNQPISTDRNNAINGLRIHLSNVNLNIRDLTKCIANRNLPPPTLPTTVKPMLSSQPPPPSPVKSTDYIESFQQDRKGVCGVTGDTNMSINRYIGIINGHKTYLLNLLQHNPTNTGGIEEKKQRIAHDIDTLNFYNGCPHDSTLTAPLQAAIADAQRVVNTPPSSEHFKGPNADLKHTIHKLRKQIKARNASIEVLKRNPHSLANVRKLHGLNKADKHSIHLLKMQFVAQHAKVPSDKVKQMKQERFEEDNIFDNRIANNYEDYIPNPENSMVI